jgi:diamine N-acetyltransferase
MNFDLDMEKGIVIEPVDIHSIELLREISISCFVETFADINTPENMEKYLRESFSVEKLSAELSDPDSHFFIAREGALVVGYLKLNVGAAQTEQKLEHSLEIERIYVLKDYHGKRVGQLLMEKALVEARDGKFKHIWLGVWENNHRAIRFYEKNGFETFDTHLFHLGDDVQTDLLMKMEL